MIKAYRRKGASEDKEEKLDDIFAVREKKQRIEERRKRIAEKKALPEIQEAVDDTTNAAQSAKINSFFQSALDQMQISKKRLQKLRLEGEDLVRNILIAAQSKECNRKAYHQKEYLKLMNKLEDANKAAKEKFDEMMANWESPEKMKFARDLYKLIIKQKDECQKLLDVKEEIINNLRVNIRMKEVEYEAALEKNNKDLALICLRIDQLILDLTNACKEESKRIEDVFEMDRTNIIKENQEFMDKILMDQKKSMQFYVEAMTKLFDDNEMALHATRLEAMDEYNELKGTFEEDIQTLNMMMRSLKSRFLLNQEKLDYNYQVLKRHLDENKIILSEQMRLILKLNDENSELQSKHQSLKEKGERQNLQLTRAYKYSTQQIEDVDEKVRHFKNVYFRQFRDIWLMNEREAKQLTMDILNADEFIHLQVLGMPWEPSTNLDYLKNEGPIVTDKENITIKSAMDVVKSVLEDMSLQEEEMEEEVQNTSEMIFIAPLSESAGSTHEKVASEDFSDKTSLLEALIHSPFIKHILMMICNEMDFMIEEKSLRLLSRLEKDTKTLMSLDAIFRVIELDTEEDVKFLASHLKKYAKEIDGKKQLTSVTLLEGLTDFIKIFKVSREKTPDYLGNCIYKHRDSSEDEAYWNQYKNVLSTSRYSLWQTVLKGLNKYCYILKKRQTSLARRENLIQENNHLRSIINHFKNQQVF